MFIFDIYIMQPYFYLMHRIDPILTLSSIFELNYKLLVGFKQV